MSAAWALVGDAPGFFTLRQPGPWLQLAGSLEATSFYETKLLKATLEQLVSTVHILSDLTLGLGKVVHDYLAWPPANPRRAAKDSGRG